MKGIKYPLQTMFRNTTLAQEHIVKVSFESRHIHSLTDKLARPVLQNRTDMIASYSNQTDLHL